jgi:hypothetical protein
VPVPGKGSVTFHHAGDGFAAGGMLPNQVSWGVGTRHY